MPELACLNGKIMPIEAAMVPIDDRGYQFGDAVYEFIASFNGRLFALEPHLDRLENSLRALNYPPVSRQEVHEAINETFTRAGLPNGGVYLQISRGVAPRNHAIPGDLRPQIAITVRELPSGPDTLRQSGARVITVPDIRWGRCDIKTTQLLPNTLAKQQALDSGAHDAVFISPEGFVREGTTFNVFILDKGCLLTHPKTPRILPGITRDQVIDICREQAIPVHEVYFDKARLLAAEEVFSSGTVTEVMPIVQVDGHPIGTGRPGPMAGRIFELLRKREM
jgi:D-alanine transaminase